MQRERWQQVKRVFESVCELPSELRAAVLDQACAADLELRREVESILAAGDEAPEFLDAPAVVSFGVPLLQDDLPESLVGRTVGPYRLVQHVASGGMGSVYRAERTDGQFQQVVAIKFIKLDLAPADCVERFRTQRRTLAGLEHANIARLFDGGVTGDGLSYLVMEFVDGQPLDDYCEEYHLGTAERLRLFRTVCAAVQYAHQRLVVHRDLKPGNIFVTRDGVVKLLDFGIAKVLEADSPAADNGPAATVLRRLTPEYASPEQFRGEPVTTATDVYSLGVVLYELLTGCRPHVAKSRQYYDLARTVCEDEPERPSTAVRRRSSSSATASGVPPIATPPSAERPMSGGDAERLRRRLTGDIDAIVLMALRKEPARRYASVEQFSDDIRRHLDGLPVLARRSTIRYRSAKFIRRHTAMVAAVSAVAISLVAGIVATAWAADVARRERDSALRAERFAEQEKANAVVEARKSERVTKFLQKMLSSADPGNAGRDVTVRQVLENAAGTVATEFASDPEVESAVRTSIGETFIGLGRYDDAEPQLRSAGELQRRIHGDQHWDVANALNSLGVLYYFKGDLAESEKCCTESLAINRKLYGDEHPDVATALNNLGVLVRLRGDSARAEQILREALAIRRRLYGAEHVEVAETLNNLAVLLQRRGDLAAAEPLFREALAIRRKLLGDNHPRTIQSSDNLASLLNDKSDLAAAEPLMRAALAAERELLGDRHPDVSVTLYNLGGLLVKKQDFASAEPLLRDSVAIRRETLPAGDLRTADAIGRWAGCLTAMGQFAEAEPLLLEAYQTVQKSVGADHTRTVATVKALIELYEKWGRPDAAAEWNARLPAPSAEAAAPR